MCCSSKTDRESPTFAVVSRLTHATALAGEGDEEVMTAVVAAGAGKAVGEDAAFEVAALSLKFPPIPRIFLT